jgi:hypothetical protein
MRTVLTAALLLAVTATAVRADESADAKAVIEKAIKAHGGLDKISKVKAVSMKMKGKLHLMGMDLDFTGASYLQDPDKLRNEVDLTIMGTEIKTAQIFNGDKGWATANGNTIELDKDQVAEAKEKMYSGGVGKLFTLGTDKEFKLTLLGESKIDGKETIGVRVAHKDHKDVNLYFDKKTHLLIMTETREKSPEKGEEVAAKTVVHEYKEVDGIQTASKVSVTHDDKAFVEAEISDFKVEEKLDDALFSKP